ncbi:ferritin-like domain-containing protein [Robertmurraya kyonggiensis]|uniref:Iminophenyl-pyruvate dimer synthase domain-containing protein n=1 Tax=Robertmurraya kyonggiensis TaxID=1037680 RepID=A0A4U1D979_9BACI|nr:ferritin-like protein [Robertmurraya kyonggiensis]TKC19105.1 hypothetical protein FA727_06040 [Robertmurraya kyonggiensis]
MSKIVSLPPKIQSIDELKNYLNLALEIELSTIPPYLVSMYTLEPDTNKESLEIIRTVVVEEMLHMLLVANIINAIGGTPVLNNKENIPKYPYEVPIKTKKNELLKINLQSFSREAIETFLEIEKNTPLDEIRESVPRDEPFNSIAEFYSTILDALIYFNNHIGEGNFFCGDPTKQIHPEYYYNSGGTSIIVTDLESAINAINLIIDQGHREDESSFCHEGPSHYQRFFEILNTNSEDSKSFFGDRITVKWDKVYKIYTNPKHINYKNHEELEKKSKEFNILYSNLLDLIHIAINGKPEVFNECNIIMFSLRNKATELMKIPLEDNFRAAPTFEYIEESNRK